MQILLKTAEGREWEKYPRIAHHYAPDDLADNDLVTLYQEIAVVYTYPLSQLCEKKFTRSGGFHKHVLLTAIQQGYHDIYTEEHAAVGDPGHVPGMLNRARSNGPHGIWGHDIGDLVLEGVEETAPGLFTLQIGS
jgi:hypothetical protein